MPDPTLEMPLAEVDPQLASVLAAEIGRQRDTLEMIASENFAPRAVLECQGSVLTNKYAEGYPGRRYYGGQENTDAVERLAVARARALFRCEHANVQPLSGSPMNQAVYLAFLEPGDVVMAMDLSHGGHLTHGAPVSHMGRVFNFVRYRTRPDEGGRIDFDGRQVLDVRHDHTFDSHAALAGLRPYTASKYSACRVGSTAVGCSLNHSASVAASFCKAIIRSSGTAGG